MLKRLSALQKKGEEEGGRICVCALLSNNTQDVKFPMWRQQTAQSFLFTWWFTNIFLQKHAWLALIYLYFIFLSSNFVWIRKIVLCPEVQPFLWESLWNQMSLQTPPLCNILLWNLPWVRKIAQNWTFVVNSRETIDPWFSTGGPQTPSGPWCICKGSIK